MQEIIKLSITFNSLEISRLLNKPLSIIEKTLIDYYYDVTWKVSKEELQEIAKLIYITSPLILSNIYNISEPTLKKYLNHCKLYSDKHNNIAHKNKVQDKNIIEDYNNGMSLSNLRVKYLKSKKELLTILAANNISTNKVTFDDTLFNIIDSEEKAYWLGFFYADGNVSNTDNTFELSLQILDTEHLYKCKQFFKSKRNIILQTKTNKRCRIYLRSNLFKTNLINLGCIPKKSLVITFPDENQVPKEYIIPFIRGYFDGDGCLSYQKTGHSDKIIPRVSIVGTENMLIGILRNITGLNTIACKKVKNIYSISLNKKDSVLFLNSIYNNPSIYLTRKYSRYLYFKKHNFAVSKSDFRDNDSAISVKAKQFIYNNYNIIID